jgi:hypothetical protein
MNDEWEGLLKEVVMVFFLRELRKTTKSLKIYSDRAEFRSEHISNTSEERHNYTSPVDVCVRCRFLLVLKADLL